MELTGLGKGKGKREKETEVNRKELVKKKSRNMDEREHLGGREGEDVGNILSNSS